MEHPNATFARNLYAVLAAGDVATVFDALADDLVMVNDIGAGPWREPSCSTARSARTSWT
jgi:ketosteroid isomerase-like protein